SKSLPQSLLDSSKLGFINVHASLLPRWRGAAPIQRAIQAGDAKTGVCIMNLVAELDAGEVYQTAEIDITPEETSGELFEKLSILGAETLIKALPGILNQTLPKVVQSQTGITYARKVKKEEALIDWSRSAQELVDHCRAMQPWPGCHSFYQGKKIRLFGAFLMAGEGEKSQIIELGDNLVVATGKGLIAFREAQLEGKRRMPISSLLNGFSMHLGEHLC
ncbi:MAG: methionyl-tRNA formyltransferase, partial [Myxococcaceae bacterium]